jgi:hypothetical protein
MQTVIASIVLAVAGFYGGWCIGRGLLRRQRRTSIRELGTITIADVKPPSPHPKPPKK